MEATRHFKSIYSDESVNTPPNAALMDLVPKLVKRKENNDLMQMIKLADMKSVMEGMEEDKAPGPDGFECKIRQSVLGNCAQRSF